MRYLTIGSLALFAASCGPASETRYDGVETKNIAFHLYSPDMGIHPSQSVLDDPGNPFALVPADELNNGTPASPARKWAFNPLTAPPVTCFYIWATTLAKAPSGENQFYTAERLYDVYRFNLAAPADLAAVRGMAMGAYKALLAYFPDAYNRTADGTPDFDYASVALQRLLTLAPADPLPEGWILITDSKGNLRATRI